METPTKHSKTSYNELKGNTQFNSEDEEEELNSLAWEGAKIMKELVDPPRVFPVLGGYVALAVLNDNVTVAVVNKDPLLALAILSEDVRALTAMNTFRKTRNSFK